MMNKFKKLLENTLAEETVKVKYVEWFVKDSSLGPEWDDVSYYIYLRVNGNMARVWRHYITADYETAEMANVSPGNKGTEKLYAKNGEVECDSLQIETGPAIGFIAKNGSKIVAKSILTKNGVLQQSAKIKKQCKKLY